jgi:Zn finger protein HypA/HybF involved in hydrogenase expression
MGAREGWIEAARQAIETGTVEVTCPEHGDAALRVEWIATTTGNGKEGEYRIWCPTCGAQNFALVRNRKAP